jgi:hypothetical protein
MQLRAILEDTVPIVNAIPTSRLNKAVTDFSCPGHVC